MSEKLVVILLVLSVSVTTAFAEYAANIKSGNGLYKAGEYEQALEYYYKAQEEKPNEKLATFIKKLEAKVGVSEVKKDTIVRSMKPREETSSQPQAGKSLLRPRNIIIACGLVTGVTGVTMGLMQKGKSEDLYDQYMAAETAEDAESKYTEHENKVKSSGTWYVIGGVGLGLAAGSYLVDKFWLSRGNYALAPYRDGFKTACVIKF